MGIRRIAKSCDEAIRTLSVYDEAILNDRAMLPTGPKGPDGVPTLEYSDAGMARFAADRSDTSGLSIRAAPEGEPWEGPTWFSMRPLDDYEFHTALRLAGIEREALRSSDGIATPLLWWMFRLGCVAWEGLWRDGPGGRPEEVRHEAVEFNGRKAVSVDAMRSVAIEAVSDLGSVTLHLTSLTADEKKVSG